MEFEIKIIDYSKFELITNETNFKIFNNSRYDIVVDGGSDDDRDVVIKQILSDIYLITLSVDDINEFIDTVNDGVFICDLSSDNENNKYIIQAILLKEEKEKYTEEFILNNINEDFKFLKIQTIERLPKYLFTKYPLKFNWDNISYLYLSLDFVAENEEYINWDNISCSDLLMDMDFVEKYYSKLNIPDAVKKYYPESFVKIMEREMTINQILG